MSGFGADFHWVNDGLFPTASQLGIEVVSLAQSKRHQSRSRGCTASLMVRTLGATDDSGGHEEPIAQAVESHRLEPSQLALKQHNEVMRENAQAQSGWKFVPARC